MLAVRKPLRVVLIAALVTGVTLPSPLVGGVIATITEDAANDARNHRMEEAIVIGDAIFENALVDDYVQVNMTARGNYGDAIRAYLFKDATYTLATNTRIDSSGTPQESFGSIDDTVLSVVGGDNVAGLGTAATGLNFDYASNGFSVIASDDDGHSNPNFSSVVELSVTQSGYFYFYLSKWNGGATSAGFDGGEGYNVATPGIPVDANGSFHSDAGVATGVVTGSLGASGDTASLFINVNVAASSNDTPVVPEPASAAIFALLGAAACCSQRSKRRKQRHPE